MALVSETLVQDLRIGFTVLAIILSYTWYVAPRAPRGSAAVPIVLIAALTIWCAARTGDWGLDWRALLPGPRVMALVTVPAGLVILLAGAALGTLHDRRDFLGTFGGIVVDGRMVTGRNGFGGEVGHVLIPWRSIPGLGDLSPRCNCGRTGDLESLCSLTGIRQTLLPHFLSRYPDHPLHGVESAKGAVRVRGLADGGDAMSLETFRVQARALGLFADQMINVFDPTAFWSAAGPWKPPTRFATGSSAKCEPACRFSVKSRSHESS